MTTKELADIYRRQGHPDPVRAACGSGATRRPHKYGAQPETVDGHRFASKAEANAYRSLRIAEACGKISGLELQPRFKMPCGVTYVADFRFREGGKVRVADVKGVQTAVFRLKLKLMKYFHPEITVELWGQV